MEDVEDYLSRLLVEFVSTDRVYSVKSRDGIRLSSIFEMLAEADIRLNADSFERERQVHKHIGDYILFWSGVNPHYLNLLKLDDGRHLHCDYASQGKQSYFVVSTFDHAPFSEEAPTFRKLSDAFEGLTATLARVRGELPFGIA